MERAPVFERAMLPYSARPFVLPGNLPQRRHIHVEFEAEADDRRVSLPVDLMLP